MRDDYLDDFGVRVYWYEFNPVNAKSYLDAGRNFRKLKPALVDEYADLLRQGKWTPRSGATILIRDDGVLIDGQHRLSAVIKSGVPMLSLVIDGVEAQDDRNIDRGKKRTVGEWLQHQGEKNCATLASCLRHLFLMDRGGKIYDSHSKVRMDVTSAIETLEKHRLISDVVSRTSYPNIRRTEIALVCYCGGRAAGFKDDGIVKLSREFAKGVSSGNGMEEGDPRIALSKRLKNDRESKSKLTPKRRLALTIVAWNAFVEGRKLNVLRWHERTRLGAPNPFPQFID